MSLPRRAARAMLSAAFISGGLDQLKNPQPKRQPAQPVTATLAGLVPQLPKDPEQLVKIDGAIKVGGGALLLLNRFARPAALVLAATTVPTTFAGHRFWETADPDQRVSDRVEFFKNISLLGGLLIAALDTGGRPSVPWVAGKAVKGAARSVEEAGEAVVDTAGALGGAIVGTAGVVGAGVVGAAGALAHGAESVTHRSARGRRRSRRDLRRRAAELRGSVAETAGKVSESVAETAGKVSGSVAETAGKVSESVAHTAGRLGDAAGDIASSAKDRASELASRR